MNALGARLAAAALAALVYGCGEREPPRWIELARGFQPRPLLELAQRWQREAGMDPAGCSAEPWCVRVTHPLPRSAWVRGDAARGDAARGDGARGDGAKGAGTDTWTAALPGGAFAFGAPGFLQLRSERQPIAPAPAGPELAPGTFRLERGQLVLRLADGAEPAEDLQLTQRMDSGRLPAEGVWQVRFGGDEFGSGIPVWTGLPEEIACDLPAASRLSFEARFQSRAAGAVTLRVRLDGATVFECVDDSAWLAREGRWVSFALPAAARGAARIALEVEGPTGQALFLRPVVGPAEVGTPGARPWPDARGDVVLFLADTLRADALAPGGGPADVAPALARFAASARRFPNARSNASWTLPSISTLLTGLAPGQHTANDMDRLLPDELPTIVEALARSGYRTCAVTDAAFFSPTHGLEQGFESFVQRSPAGWDLDWTVQRALAFLAHDDGRPLFLLVHTYRAHMPYRVGADEDVQPWKELLDSGCVLLKAKGKIAREEWRRRLADCRERYRALYLEGVRDLDRGFGELLAGLERGGIGARAYLVFTSDHGEALGENDELFHDGELWDSKLRIPLFLRGPGIAPGDVAPVVTLLDLAPTLAELAGIARDPRWPGASLLSVTGERPACAFQFKKSPQITVIEGGRKLFTADAETLAQGGFDEAYDLALDPHEERPVAGEAWPAELARRHAALVRALLEPASGAVSVPLSSERQRELGALGYGGEGSEEQ